jgi:hydroxyacylglutathione hydrolase
MIIKTFIVGMLSTNCYVANCEETQETIDIDPGMDYSSEAQPIFNYIMDRALKMKFIVNTHGHPDHVRGDGIFKKKYGVPICIHMTDFDLIRDSETNIPPPNVLLNDEDPLTFGAEMLKVMHTLGHTPGGMSLVWEDIVFTGDTLFAGSIGRVDFQGGSASDMRLSLKKLMRVPDSFAVYPGNGAASTIGEERRINPFVRCL